MVVKRSTSRVTTLMLAARQAGGRDIGDDGVVTRTQRGRFERFLFSFMGPPQLGDPGDPAGPAAQAQGPAVRCPKCAMPYDDHEIVRTPRLTYTRCPQTGPNGQRL